MIRMRLNELLAERSKTANRVFIDTGISRSTLSGIINNSNKMVQLETLNTLCTYLDIQPGEFFEHTNFDLEFAAEIDESKLNIMDESNLENLYVDIRVDPVSVVIYCKKKYMAHTETLTGKYTLSETSFIEVEDKTPSIEFPEIHWREGGSNEINDLLFSLSPAFQQIAGELAGEAASKELSRVIKDSTDIDLSIPVDFV